MTRKYLLCFGLSVISLSCRSSRYSDELAGPQGKGNDIEFFSTPAQVMTYSWTNDSSAIGSARSAKGYIEKIVKTAEANRNLPGVGGDNEVGFGLYTAADPINSKEYGRILVEVPLLSGSKLGVGNLEGRNELLPIIRDINDVPAIIYNFGGINFSGGGRAIVLRSTSLLDMASAKSYDCRSGDISFSDHKPMRIRDTTTVSEILSVWCDQMQFFSRVGASTELKNANHTISDYAVVEAVYSEIFSAGTKVKKILASLKGAEGRKRFPRLSELIEAHLNGRFDDEIYKFQIYLEGIAKILLETIPVKPGAIRSPAIGDAPELSEVIELFKQLEKLSPNDQPGSTPELTKSIINHWKATPSAADRLGEAIEAVLLVKDRTTRDGFNAWQIPNLDSHR